MENSLSDTLLLPDGRKLGYAQYGSPTGRPIFYVHGHPASRLEGAHLHDVGLRLGARIISPERPGFGLSSPQPGRTLLDYPKDLEQLAGHLKLERYGVLVCAARKLPTTIFKATRLLMILSTGSIGRRTICARLRLRTT
jgi:pimeloyl-ACP methyl ester carboxylesterase